MVTGEGKNGAVRWLRRTAVATSGAALLAVGAVGGVAATGVMTAAAGSIHGCVNSRTRALTVPKPGRSCPHGTSPLAWNVRGPGGPAGLAGAPGWGEVISGPRYRFSNPEGLAFDGRHVWVANSGNDSVTEVNAATGTLVANLSGGSYNFSGPRALAFDRSHVWVANFGNNSVTEVNAADGSWMRTAAGSDFGFASPGTLAFDGHQVWVANSDANSLTVLPPG